MYVKSLSLYVFCVIVIIANIGEGKRYHSRGYGRTGQYVTNTELSRNDCRDMVSVDYCKKVKEMKYCGLPLYSSRCRLTCGICTTKRETVTKANSVDKVCRDVGGKNFCKKTCRRRPYVAFAKTFCKRSCNFCKPESKCKDEKICERLTTFYKIDKCSTLPRRLRKRAMRRCPKLCGVCLPPVQETSDSQASQALRTAVDIIETPAQRGNTIHNNRRQPHPQIQSVGSNQTPRRGVFYMYTDYLSL
ncbi:uncharacterized protein LOC124434707 [Xenia sp. Carnegie-2017]|uniref:uncharacterized protein LOC124434707 n=1 Tax=Xenia sp. Carnegie-2017 TaxID=2897299 RepID=UPI001F044047|nr:uncharacterized protein LOC124434707 [Xenia sp. Carnegie-2017]